MGWNVAWKTYLMTRVNIDVSRIKKNRENGSLDPVIRIVDETETRFAHYLEIQGPCRVVYDPSHPGTTCWIETDAELVVVETPVGQLAAKKLEEPDACLMAAGGSPLPV